MRNTYIRPLMFDYVDANQKHYKIKEIPTKFLQEHDDYQKKRTKTETMLRSRSSSQRFAIKSPQENQQYQAYTNQNLLPQQLKNKEQQKHQYSMFGCCESGIQEGELCQKCVQSLCQNCINRPEKVKFCTKCLQKLCEGCKKSLKIVFPEYKLRNYAINIKNYHNLHFSDCSCKHCNKK